MSKEDPRVVKTLAGIDEALITCLEQYPLSKITVDTICKEANINRSTFYKYYTDKYDLLDKFINNAITSFNEHLMPYFIDLSYNEIQQPQYKEYLRTALGYLQEQRRMYMALWTAGMERNVYEEMIETETACIFDKLKGSMDESSEKYIYLKLFARSFPNQLLMYIRWWFEHIDKVSLDDITQLVDDTTKDGVFLTVKKLI